MWLLEHNLCLMRVQWHMEQMFCEICLRMAEKLAFMEDWTWLFKWLHSYGPKSVPSTRGFGTEKRSKKPIFQGLKLPVSINGDTEFISPFVSRTFELIAFLSSNFKVSVAVAFLQRRDNLICFDGNAISYSVSANLFDKTGDLRVSAQFRQQVVDHFLPCCILRSAHSTHRSGDKGHKLSKT